MQDTNEKLKIQVESYKKRLGAVTREKREYEEKFLKLTHEVQKKVFLKVVLVHMFWIIYDLDKSF